jgi:hypothetical protein
MGVGSMKINVATNIPAVQDAIAKAASQVPYALSVALNKTAGKAKDAVKAEMPSVFDRPTPWVLNSLRVKFATKQKPEAELAYKDRNAAESSRSMIEPHVFAGRRHYKAMEARLFRAGLMPAGYNAIPGEGARLDGYGNMSKGQITQVLNVLGTYREAGYNKANAKTIEKLARGNAKKNVYGFTYWVNPVEGRRRARHIPPGVYQRVITGFGTSLKPILIFAKQASYRKRLPFFETVQTVVDKEFTGEFNRAFDEALRTALLKSQGQLL